MNLDLNILIVTTLIYCSLERCPISILMLSFIFTICQALASCCYHDPVGNPVSGRVHLTLISSTLGVAKSGIMSQFQSQYDMCCMHFSA